MSDSEFSTSLLNWYHTHARALPWRKPDPDPYAVWVSEIMLQQTRVEAVIPYFTRWMERFPTLDDLARATQQEVLGQWEGLGYYSRARHLHRAAQIVFQERGGALPHRVEDLQALPGIGRYTAGAIASIAFGIDAPALDGNARRVLARVFDVDLPARSPEGEKRLWQLAQQHLPPGQAGAYNQALMDLGSAICTPRQPACPLCPVNEMCLARSRGLQEERPVQVNRPRLPHYLVAAAVICKDRRVLITQRPNQGLLGGLWEFPGGKLQPGEDLIACLKREICEELEAPIEVGRELGVYRHAYTHFRVTVHAFHCRLPGEARLRPLQVQDLCWVERGELGNFPMGKIDRQISHDLQAMELLC